MAPFDKIPVDDRNAPDTRAGQPSRLHAPQRTASYDHHLRLQQSRLTLGTQSIEADLPGIAGKI